ncbi:MAG: hypothetical protein IT567_04810 [Alphaproteobacteria bacterium]|nr:hypothetical protein [Alphaproteobacteria bacterium]
MAINSGDLNNFATDIFNNVPGAIDAYYGYLGSNGIPYGELAGDVAAESGLFGAAAKAFFEQNNLIDQLLVWRYVHSRSNPLIQRALQQ